MRGTQKGKGRQNRRQFMSQRPGQQYFTKERQELAFRRAKAWYDGTPTDSLLSRYLSMGGGVQLDRLLQNHDLDKYVGGQCDSGGCRT